VGVRLPVRRHTITSVASRGTAAFRRGAGMQLATGTSDRAADARYHREKAVMAVCHRIPKSALRSGAGGSRYEKAGLIDIASRPRREAAGDS
jgi:hypothetical protein